MLALVGFILFSSGGDGPSQSPSQTPGIGIDDGGARGEFTLGPRTDYGAQRVDNRGGTMAVDQPGSPIDALEVDIPPGALDTPTDFKVSYRPITAQTFDDRVKPVTPLITVDNGGMYAGDVMAVKVPVSVPAGQFAMGFFYNEKTHALEGMPIAASDATSVTVATRHFSEFFVSLIPESVLTALTLDSGFAPGVDDWEFVNRGSFIEPKGQCAGQSAAAIWYYYERKQQDGRSLFGRYDNYKSGETGTPTFWQDDNLAYRMASTIQKDLDWDGITVKTLRSLRGSNDTAQFLAFAAAIYVTHKPQLVGITNSQSGGGHAIVAYKVEPSGIWVADPNRPGDKSEMRKIAYADGKFTPYNSAASADDPPQTYDKIGFNATTALIDWAKIGQRFQEMEAGSVGNEYFPAYQVTVNTAAMKNTYAPLVDGLELNDPSFLLKVPGHSADDTGYSVTVDGAYVAPGAKGWPLSPGVNKLGIGIYFKAGTQLKYVDFYRVSVVYKPQPTQPFEASLVYSLAPGIRVSNPLNLKVSGTVEGPEGLKPILKPEGTQIMDVFVTSGEKITLNYEVDAVLSKGTIWEESATIGDFGDSAKSEVRLSNSRVKVISGGNTLAELGAESGSYSVPASQKTRQVNVQLRLEWDYEQTFYNAKGVVLGGKSGTTGVYFLHFIVDTP